MEENKQNLPEAPTSATVKIKSPNGFEYLFTMRDESAKSLLFKMKTMEDHFMTNGFTALAQGSKFPQKTKDYVEGKVCPIDGGKLVKPQPGSKQPIKCENNKWNSMTKRSYGCTYIEWPNKLTNDVPERDINNY